MFPENSHNPEEDSLINSKVFVLALCRQIDPARTASLEKAFENLNNTSRETFGAFLATNIGDQSMLMDVLKLSCNQHLSVFAVVKTLLFPFYPCFDNGWTISIAISAPSSPSSASGGSVVITHHRGERATWGHFEWEMLIELDSVFVHPASLPPSFPSASIIRRVAVHIISFCFNDSLSSDEKQRIRTDTEWALNCRSSA